MQKPNFLILTKPVFVLLITCALFCLPNGAHAQNPNPSLSQIRNMTPNQQRSAVIDARKKGYNLLQLEGLAKAQGATPADLLVLRNVWTQSEYVQKRTTEDNPTQPQTTPFGNQTTIESFVEEQESDIFGSAFFANKTITETPQFYVATPSGYRLGPSDEITIDVWGASENRYEVTLSRQGVVRIDRLKPLYLSGLTLAAAERKIRNEFSSIYTGLSADSPNESKVYLDVNLQKARSIVVNITGNVKAPGTYTISGFSSVLNALYAAGGPTENGSYRDITVLRNGKTATTIDLYDYFVKGTYPSFFLNDQDVIVVAPHHNRITVEGAFKTGGRFETLKNETVEDLLSYTGGFASTAYKHAVYLDRVLDLQRQMIKVSTDNYNTSPLQDGDIIEAKNISNNYLNKVSVTGEVYLPGNYPLDATPTLSALLESTSGPTANAYTDAAILYRSQQGFVNEVKTVDLDDVISKSKDVKLKPNDSLVVISSKNIKPEKTVSIQGMVNAPDVYEFYNGMTARDLILIANGFKDKANIEKIELYSNSSSENKPIKVNSRSFSFDQSGNEKILPSDLLVVRSIPGYRPTEFVRLEGSALNPGAYPLTKKDYKIYDLYLDSGGNIGMPDKLEVLVERIVLDETLEKIEDVSDTLDLFKDEEKITIKIGVEFSKVLAKKGNHPENIILKPQDKIVFLKEDSTVSILGEVQQETLAPFSSGISVRSAILAAGGFKSTGDKKNVFVVYQNGKVKGTSSFLFFRLNPKLKPGSTIVVPQKAAKRPFNVQETIGLASTLASLALIINTITTN
jgi:protein involved in polysaccharide export with SLBB domain